MSLNISSSPTMKARYVALSVCLPKIRNAEKLTTLLTAIAVAASLWGHAAEASPAAVYHQSGGANPARALPDQLGNISTRLRVGTGDNALIAGFIVTGTQPKRIIVRGIGSSLPFADRLANPTLELRDSSGALLDSNDNWVDSLNKQAIIDSTVSPASDLEAAIVATVPASNSSYTAILRGANNATGIGVVEVYDLDQSADSKLANISTRGFVDTGDNVMIGGTIITGDSSAIVLLRAIGPSLSGANVPNPLADPTLDLHDGNGVLVASNDDWRESQEVDIVSTTIPPTGNAESAILRILPPGAYTAIVRGKDASVGVALMEVYQLPDSVAQTIPPNGGTVDYPGVAAATFPSGAFPSDQTVALSTTSDGETGTTFNDTAAIFDVGIRSSFEVRIKVGTTQPQTDVTVTLGVPIAFRDATPPNSEIRVFGLNHWEDEEEILDTFEMLPERFPASSETVIVTVPPWMFTDALSSTGEFEATLILGTTPISQIGDMPDPQSGPIHSGNFEEGGTAPLDGVCGDKRLAPPLDGDLNVKSDFGPREPTPESPTGKHKGIDYGAIAGTPVKAMHSGVVEEIGFQKNPAGWGWGQFIVIKGEKWKTRYAHLTIGSMTVKKGQEVSSGQMIALSGSSGAKAPHLHVEYIQPDGSTTDPAPVICVAGIRAITQDSHVRSYCALIRSNMVYREEPPQLFLSLKKLYSEAFLDVQDPDLGGSLFAAFEAVLSADVLTMRTTTFSGGVYGQQTSGYETADGKIRFRIAPFGAFANGDTIGLKLEMKVSGPAGAQGSVTPVGQPSQIVRLTREGTVTVSLQVGIEYYLEHYSIQQGNDLGETGSTELTLTLPGTPPP